MCLSFCCSGAARERSCLCTTGPAAQLLDCCPRPLRAPRAGPLAHAEGPLQTAPACSTWGHVCDAAATLPPARVFLGCLHAVCMSLCHALQSLHRVPAAACLESALFSLLGSRQGLFCLLGSRQGLFSLLGLSPPQHLMPHWQSPAAGASPAAASRTGR